MVVRGGSPGGASSPSPWGPPSSARAPCSGSRPTGAAGRCPRSQGSGAMGRGFRGHVAPRSARGVRPVRGRGVARARGCRGHRRETQHGLLSATACSPSVRACSRCAGGRGSSTMRKLSSEARALLEQYREESEIHDQPDAAVLERIESSVEHDGAVSAEAPPRAAAWMAWGAAAAASVATIWVWNSRAELRVAAPSPVSSAVDRVLEETELHLHVPAKTIPATSRAVVPTPPLDAPAPVPVPPPRGQRHAADSEGPATDDGLQRELELLRQARVALSAGRSAGAKASLRAHALSYPHGQLAEEREALLVVVRCSGGETKTGRVAFERSHPRSHHLPSIRQACDPKKTTGSVTDGKGGGQ